MLSDLEKDPEQAIHFYCSQTRAVLQALSEPNAGKDEWVRGNLLCLASTLVERIEACWIEVSERIPPEEPKASKEQLARVINHSDGLDMLDINYFWRVLPRETRREILDRFVVEAKQIRAKEEGEQRNEQ